MSTEKNNNFSNFNFIHKSGDTNRVKAYKSTDGASGIVEGYLVTWGNNNDTDLQGEFFTPRTEFCLDWFTNRPVLYHHGLDGQAGLRKIGSIKSVETDDLGLWVQAQLDLRDRYAQAVYDMVKSQDFGWSSGSVDHLVKIADTGEIAVWPLIEGSITPTPAQPSKTMVRALKSGKSRYTPTSKLVALPAPNLSYGAFKAILQSSDGDDATHFLRGLDARVGQFSNARTKSDESFIGESTMAKTSAKRLARAYADAFGIKTDDSEIDTVAGKLEEQVDAEVAGRAAEELEMEAALTALEEEMLLPEQEDIHMARSVRRNRNYRGYRNADEAVMADDIAAQMEDELAAQMEDIAVEMADEIAAEFEEEASFMAEEEALTKAASRSLRRKAVRRALRQLEATDDVQSNIGNAIPIVEGGTGELEPEYLGDFSDSNPPTENFKRYGNRRRPARGYARRGYGFRTEGEAIMEDDAFLMDEPVRRARRARRGYRTEDTAYNAAEEEVKTQEDAIMLEEVAAQAYRNGYRKGVRRAYRTTDETNDPDLLTNDTTAKRARRNAVEEEDVKRASRNMTEAEKEEEEAAKAFRRGYRSAVRRARRSTEEALMAEPYMAEEESYMGDDEAFLMDESYASDSGDEALMFDEPVRRYGRSTGRRATGRNFRGKSSSQGYGSGDYDRQAQYWRNRAMKAELTEVPGERHFGSVKTTDVADRAGAYNNAFKSYLYRGIGMMTDTEKYVLQGKGKVNWGATKSHDSQLGVDPRVKTYFGGADSSVGFAVPPDWVAELNKNIMTQTVMAPECRTRTTTSDRIVQPNLITTDARRSHAAQVRWPGEVISSGAEHRTIEDQLSQIDVPIHVMLLSLVAGNSALEDVTYSLEDEINEAFSEAVAIEYDSLIWSGDGQAKMQGIVVNNQVVGSRSLNMQSVSGYVPSGSPDGIVTADTLKEMLFHLPRGYRQRAKWYMNSNTGLQIATLKDGEGNYLIDQRDESIQSVGVPDMLLGRPIVYNEYADDIAEDGFPIVLGDLSRGYLIGKRVDFSIRRFDDSGYAELDQVLFLGRARLGGQVLQPASMKVLKVAAS